MYSGFFFVSDLIFLAAQHTQCCLHISTCFQSMMWILSLMRSVVASLHHPKLHTCQQEATGAKKKELLLFFFFINSPHGSTSNNNYNTCLRGLHHDEALIIVITHTPTECPPEVPECVGPHKAADPCKSRGLMNCAMKLVFPFPPFDHTAWLITNP